MADPASMTQLGSSLTRIIALMADNYNIDIPFLFAKLDIKDGFWRLTVNDDDDWNFCYVLPSKTDNIDDTTIVVPNCLQMGWCKSPHSFVLAQKPLETSSRKFQTWNFFHLTSSNIICSRRL